MNESELLRRLSQGWVQTSPGVWSKPGRAGAKALPAANAKPTERNSLVRLASREEPSRHRVEIHFRIYAVRPADWDGYHIKELQDVLGHAGVLDGDSWDVLCGRVTSEKVHTKAEERTEILMERTQ